MDRCTKMLFALDDVYAILNDFASHRKLEHGLAYESLQSIKADMDQLAWDGEGLSEKYKVLAARCSCFGTICNKLQEDYEKADLLMDKISDLIDEAREGAEFLP